MAKTSPSEIRALAQIVDEIDYYQILDVPRTAPLTALRAAYHSVARRYHPTSHFDCSPELSHALERINKRVTEAYAVLRDARRRKVYDERLSACPGQRRLHLAEAESEVERRSSEDAHGRTPGGRRYFALARSEKARGNVAEAERHLQMALTFEPDNAQFQEAMDELRPRKRRG